jgi:hypothetical protein
MAKTKQTSVGTYNPKPKKKGRHTKKKNKHISEKKYVSQGR